MMARLVDAFAFLDQSFRQEYFCSEKRWMAADAIDAALESGDVSASQFGTMGTLVPSH